jgi:hypothetical protein
MSAVGRETDVVREERRPEPPEEPRPGAVANIDDRDLLGLRTERDPQCAARRVDRDVTREWPDRDAAENAAPDDVEHHHLPTLRVAHVGVAAVRMAGRVSRLAEPAEDVRDGERRVPHDRYHADLRMSDDGAASDFLDAPGPGKRRHVSVHPTGCEVDRDESRLEISCYERDLASALDLGEPARSESERRSPGDERTTIHAKRYECSRL